MLEGSGFGGLSGLLLLVQFFFAVVIGLYFWNLLRNQQGSKTAVSRESYKERDKLKKMRGFSLTEPLSSITRPSSFADVIGQEEGIEALRAALCGPNPQHVIIYGPPGIGKTAAARLVLEEARRNLLSPFNESSEFIEIDATTVRFDERGIADTLIGSVHDPIYQGAGPMGASGVPQPKQGAVTRAHGGVLFIDEIGELHSIQMSKLLKVLEDRKVILESAYYNQDDNNIPTHIHDIFQNGLPADFRLVGATTRMPHEISPALRSRCLEVFFRPLEEDEILKIAENALNRIGFEIEGEALKELARYATNGREAVNIVQLATGMSRSCDSDRVSLNIIERVVQSGQYSPRPFSRRPDCSGVGNVNGLAVLGPNQGLVIEVEAVTIKVGEGKGSWNATGVIEEEEMGGINRTVRRKSTAQGSVETVMTALRWVGNLDMRDYDVHINFPGGIPVDGPSAGAAMAVAVISALKNYEVDPLVAMTGEVSVRGQIKPVGGIMAKIEAARKNGLQWVIIPQDNWLQTFGEMNSIKVVPVATLEELLDLLIPGFNNNKVARLPVAGGEFPSVLDAGTF
ncbi:MAG: ATP-dependent protease LonB [Syntrophomonadaceae bacterium]|nr:ATP-dependent protease LonB [Syntrophomonadaceae bacterium]